MIKNTILIITLLFSICAFSQGKYLTKDGYISFFSHSLVEDIKANNYQVVSIIDSETGEIAIQLLMKSFMFKKALMQEHFNESYIESHKYPKAIFKGFILNFNEFEGENSNLEIKGILSIHGKEKEVSTIANVVILENEINLSGHFMVEVADFDIKIPMVVRNNIAKIIKISFELNHKPYN
ncbi:YceI family protein [uncultured Lutibacter sp.]|uniref:YceI family protein n=1 Tax=uncultured Lutibacter sp. TaxID=437739 RepID=UPI00260E4A04|nr:YceI family protein [uncultured Lutibacter sp.]